PHCQITNHSIPFLARHAKHGTGGDGGPPDQSASEAPVEVNFQRDASVLRCPRGRDASERRRERNGNEWEDGEQESPRHHQSQAAGEEGDDCGTSKNGREKSDVLGGSAAWQSSSEPRRSQESGNGAGA